MIRLFFIILTIIGVLGISYSLADAKVKRDCAREAAEIVQMAVDDGYSWEYARTLGDIVYSECIDDTEKSSPE